MLRRVIGRRIFWTVNMVMVALFVVSATLQINDPDPLVWIAAYSLAALVSLAVGQRASQWPAALLISSGALGWSLYLLRPIWGKVSLAELFQDMDAKGGAVEVARESAGLLIIAGWLMVVALVQRRHTRRNRI